MPMYRIDQHPDPQDPAGVVLAGACPLGHPLRFRLAGPVQVRASCPSCVLLGDITRALTSAEGPDRDRLQVMHDRIAAGESGDHVLADMTADRADVTRPPLPPQDPRDRGPVVQTSRVPVGAPVVPLRAPCGHPGPQAARDDARGGWVPLDWSCPSCWRSWRVEVRHGRTVRGQDVLAVSWARLPVAPP